MMGSAAGNMGARAAAILTKPSHPHYPNSHLFLVDHLISCGLRPRP